MVSMQKGSRPVRSSGHVQKSSAKGILSLMEVHPRCRVGEADSGGGGTLEFLALSVLTTWRDNLGPRRGEGGLLILYT